jgi:hypothetical protein
MPDGKPWAQSQDWHDVASVTTNSEISRWSHGVLEHWKSIIPQLQYSREGITTRDDTRYKKIELDFSDL